jgi:hypothetical protein
MKLISISDLDIEFEPFQILNPTYDTTRCIFFQCSGKVSANDSVKNSDTDRSIKKFTEFFSIVKAQNIWLAVTPEYSCPWTVLLNTIANEDNFPSSGSLWALGCESITLSELKSYENATSNTIKWIYETPVENAEQLFLSPLVYVFRIKSKAGEPSLCCLVQFKGHDMGGTIFERDKLIKGTRRYLIHNPADAASINLLGIICAESLNFDYKILKPNSPYLLLHIQLNLKPYHTKMIEYRNQIFDSNYGENCEIFSLNWARGFAINDGDASNDYGGSAYLMRPSKLDQEPNFDDSSIDKNHLKGTYLTFSREYKYSSYVFHPQESIVIFDTTKVSQHHSPTVNCKRSGVVTNKVYVWKDDSFTEVSSVDDELNSQYLECGGINLQPSKREKLLSMSTGELSVDSITYHIQKGLPENTLQTLRPSCWHKSKNMNSYYLGADQNIQGTRFVLQQSQIQKTNACLSNFYELKSIIDNPEFTHYPEILSDYKNSDATVNINSKEEKGEGIRHNLIKKSGEATATGVYIGTTRPPYARKKFNELKQILDPQRLVVWYQNGGRINMVNDQLQSITEPNSELEDFTRDDSHD